MQHKGSGLAVLYAAKSSPDEKGSIADQLADARAWAQEQGLEVIAEYSEEDVTAYKGDRGPELAKALAHAESAGATLIAQHSDRLARGDGKQARHLVEIALWALKADVTIHCVQDPRTFESLHDAASMGERNMQDSKRKSNAVRAGLARRRKRGQYNGGTATFGYLHRRNERDERELIPDPEKAPFAQRIYEEYLAGAGYVEIAAGLTADGVPTRMGAPWSHCTVRSILMNPIYAGLIRHEGGFVEGLHEAIIDREAWEKAQALREAKARMCQRGRLPLGKHLFRRGFLKCGICGASMGPLTTRIGHDKRYERYYCYTRLKNASACTMPSLSRARVDEAVYAYFDGLVLDVEATREQMTGAVERKLAETRELVQAAESEVQEARARLARVRHDYASGELKASEWRELRTELGPEAQAAEAKAERLRQQLSDAEEETALSQVTTEVLEQLAEVRAAVAGEVADAEGAAAARAVLMRLFEAFVLRCDLPAAGEERGITKVGHWLEPKLSKLTLAGYEEKPYPVLVHTPTTQAKNNCSLPLELEQLFGPILIGPK